MSVSVQHPYVRMNLVASAARTADGNSGSITDFPDNLHSAEFIVDVTAASGTSPTLDLAIENSPDEGTTFYTAFRWAQITGTGPRRLVVRLLASDAGGEASIPLDPTGGALSASCPLSKTIRVRWNIGGTNPSFTFAVHALGRHAGVGVPY